MQIVNIEDIIASSDIVLLDACFLSKVDFGKMYKAKRPEDINQENLKEGIRYFLWLQDYVLRSTKVFTTPGILEEAEGLYSRVEKSSLFHKGVQRKTPNRKYQSRIKAHTKEERKRRKRNRYLEGQNRDVREAEDLDLSPREENIQTLDLCSRTFRGTLNTLREYDGRDITIDQQRVGISKNDYHLVESSCSYLRDRPNEKTAILTCDIHLIQILDDLRTGRSRINQEGLQGSVSVYRFTKFLIPEGTRILEQHNLTIELESLGTSSYITPPRL